MGFYEFFGLYYVRVCGGLIWVCLMKSHFRIVHLLKPIGVVPFRLKVLLNELHVDRKFKFSAAESSRSMSPLQLKAGEHFMIET